MNNDPSNDRRHARARVLALLLGAFVILMFAITIVKLGAAR